MSQHSRVFWAIGAVLAVAYMAAAALISVRTLDALYLPDDTYYVLSIARNISAGLGPSVDGVIQTTGFQPLIAMLLQPVFWVGLDGDDALRAAVMISALWGGACIVLAGLVVRQATGTVWAGIAAMGLTALSAGMYANAWNGLETSLAAALGLLLVWMAGAAPKDAPARWVVAFGVVAGLALWARIDAVLLLAVLVPVALVRIGAIRTAAVIGVAALTIAPWLIYCLVQTGSPMPESGGAVRQIVAYHQETGRLTVFNVLDMIKVLESALIPDLDDAWIVLVVGIFGGILARAGYRRHMDGPAILALATLLAAVVYALYLPAFWFFHRYMLLGGIGMVICFVTLIWPAATSNVWRIAAAWALVGVVALQGVIKLGQDAALWRDRGDAFRAEHFYADAAMAVLPKVPNGAIVGAMQSGALSWFAPEGVRVVNLDGVVNRAARVAVAEGRLDEYLISINATHFADWDFNRGWLDARSTAPLELVEIAARKDHLAPGEDFTLYRIEPRN